jgi:hypothetical protein
MKILKIPAKEMDKIANRSGYTKGDKLKDLVPNVGFRDAVIRFGVTILIPMALLLIDKHLIIYAAPVMAYLFITAIGHFCVVKFLWHRYVKNEPVPVAAPYGTDPNYPEESI